MDHIGPRLFVALSSMVATLVLARLAIMEARAKPALIGTARAQLWIIPAM